jgi:hypothetical protein
VVVDLLAILEGLAYVGFIAGAIFAVIELRTMARDRQTQFIMRVNEFWSTKDFEEAVTRIDELDSKDPRKMEEMATKTSLKLVVNYLDGIGDLARRGLLKKELVLDITAWDTVWDKLLPWIDSERKRTGNIHFGYGFEYAAEECRKWRAGWEQSRASTSGAR